MADNYTTKQWILSAKPVGTPTTSGPNPTFTLQTVRLPPLSDDQILVKVLYFSNDAGIRTFIGCTVDDSRLYVPPVQVETPMRAGIIGEVLESKSSKFNPGDLITEFHLSTWSERVVLDAGHVRPVAPLPAGLSITHYLGAFGGSGLTAHIGLLHVAQAKPEHTIVVSAAAGATGSMVIQVAVKLLGAKRVVGIAGSDEKCAWVRDHLGATACVNYKSPTFIQDLKDATPDEVDVFFDNVGGAVLDGVLTRMKRYGTVAVCGAVSTYNSDEPMRLHNWFEVVSQRLNVKGFFTFDYMDLVPAALKEIIAAAAEGRIKVDIEDVVPATIEEIPNVWINVYNGANKGKSITKLIS
ncbi:hypothetical protein NM208_g10457 [Fusarium decemcellulare]|uniref:Uncharacterized protein n=1 Tax=Fusarium decemcellulare TaxID=57161 RepID=A0ACC1RXW7_9HYPO|nr:hypothetical protein NM208_g10457 [Fusarium decemcellulare]